MANFSQPKPSQVVIRGGMHDEFARNQHLQTVTKLLGVTAGATVNTILHIAQVPGRVAGCLVQDVNFGGTDLTATNLDLALVKRPDTWPGTGAEPVAAVDMHAGGTDIDLTVLKVPAADAGQTVLEVLVKEDDDAKFGTGDVLVAELTANADLTDGDNIHITLLLEPDNQFV